MEAMTAVKDEMKAIVYKRLFKWKRSNFSKQIKTDTNH